MRTRATSLAILAVIATASALAVPALASTTPEPIRPPVGDWTTGRSTDKAAASPWGCHGHADPPGRVTMVDDSPGVGFDAYTDCVGAFGTQKTCIKLQEKDYYGTFYDRTTYRCSKETVAARSYRFSSESCKGAGFGTFRVYARSTAYPEAAAKHSYGASEPATLCQGF